MDKYSSDKARVSLFEETGLSFQDFVGKVKSTCNQMYLKFSELEKKTNIKLKQGKISKSQLNALLQAEGAPNTARLFAGLYDISYSFRDYLSDNFFELNISEQAIELSNNERIRKNINDLVYLMGIRGILTDADKHLLNEKAPILNEPIRTLDFDFESFSTTRQAVKELLLDMRINPNNYETDDAFSIEYIFWDNLFNYWLFSRFSSFLFIEAENVTYAKWHSLEAIDFIIDFAIKIQTQADKFKYKTFSKSVVAEIEELANKKQENDRSKKLGQQEKKEITDNLILSFIKSNKLYGTRNECATLLAERVKTLNAYIKESYDEKVKKDPDFKQKPHQFNEEFFKAKDTLRQRLIRNFSGIDSFSAETLKGHFAIFP